jgi:hypothetical protein
VVATATKGWYAQTAEACKPRVSHVHAIGQSECFTPPAAVLHGMSRQNLPMVSTTVHCYLHTLLISPRRRGRVVDWSEDGDQYCHRPGMFVRLVALKRGRRWISLAAGISICSCMKRARSRPRVCTRRHTNSTASMRQTRSCWAMPRRYSRPPFLLHVVNLP